MKAAPVKDSRDAGDPSGSATRRVRYGVSTGVLLIAATASCILLTMLASVYNFRFDATATREHTLSPRTLKLLGRIEKPHEIIVVADFASLDPRSNERIDDVLVEFARSSREVRYERIDAGAVGDRVRYTNLLERLAVLHKDQLERHERGTEAALAAIEPLAGGLPTLSDRLLGLRDALPTLDSSADNERRQLTDAAAAARTWVADLRKVGEVAKAALADRISGSSIPPVDRAEQALATPLRKLARELEGLRQYCVKFQTPTAPEGATSMARAAVEQTTTLRDAAASGADALERLAPLKLMAIVRTIEAGPTAVIVSEAGATAVNFEALFPTKEQIDLERGGQGELRSTGEELIATAVGSLNNPRNPIIVLVHGEPQRLFDDTGQAASDTARALLGRFIGRMRLRGIGIAEWATATQQTPPALGKLDPNGDRPVVWIGLGVSATTADGATRMGKLATALQGLIDTGANVLLTIDPSNLPGVGEPDPIGELAKAFGLKIDSGRPLMRRTSSPTGWDVMPGLALVGDVDGHPIADAVKGLQTFLPWPMAVDVAPVAADATANPDPSKPVVTGTPRAWPLLKVASDANVWGEAQWLEFRSLAQNQRGMVSNPPAPDAKWDNVGGPWVVAEAAERRLSGMDKAQRFVVVASNGWFFDSFTQKTQAVDGRTPLVFPGNSELLEASVYWLAGQDDMIAASPSGRSVSRIMTLTPGQLLALRWSLIAGLPALTLALGAMLRIVRG